MTYLAWALVIFLTALAVFGFSWLLNRGNAELDRIIRQARVEEGIGRTELPRAGLLPLDMPSQVGSCHHGHRASPADQYPVQIWETAPIHMTTYVCDRCGLPQRACTCPRGPHNPWPLASVYGPFPVDTGPLLILSDKAAANVALEREIRQRCAEAEAKIPPRWR